jgi:diaminopimelate decarboxylase
MKSIPSKLEQSIKQLKPPFYIIDIPALESALGAARRLASGLGIQYAYSYKTNYLRPICHYLDSQGVYAEVVSPFEVDITAQYGIPAERVIYNGPVKDEASIAYILSGGGLVNADSLDDLRLILKVADYIDTPDLRIGLRISFPISGVASSRFGIDAFSNDLHQAIEYLEKAPNIRLTCLHCHFPNRDARSFFLRLEQVAKVLDQLKIDFEIIDIGGGLPSELSPLVAAQLGIDQVDYDLFRQEIESGVKLVRQRSAATLLMEPGTMLAANTVHLLASIRSIKTNQTHTYYTLDVSRTNIGGLKQSIAFPHIVLDRQQTTVADPDQIFVGFTCVEGDTLGHPNYDSLQLGDLVLFSSIGSYSAVFKSPFINGDLPVYTWDGSNLQASRRQQTAADVLVCDL